MYTHSFRQTILYSILILPVLIYSTYADEEAILPDVTINYSEARVSDSTLYMEVFGIETGAYLTPQSPTAYSPLLSSQSVMSFGNAFDCILTRTMVDYRGYLPLDLFRLYGRDSGNCLNNTRGGIMGVSGGGGGIPFIDKMGYTIEENNHGRPQNPGIEINPMTFDPTWPQAWSQTIENADGSKSVQWYYNYVGAVMEGEYLGLELPSSADYKIMLGYDEKPLDIATWGYATLQDPIIVARDVENSYYWTTHLDDETLGIPGIMYSPTEEKTIDISVEADATLMLPVRYVKW